LDYSTVLRPRQVRSGAIRFRGETAFNTLAMTLTKTKKERLRKPEPLYRKEPTLPLWQVTFTPFLLREAHFVDYRENTYSAPRDSSTRLARIL